MGNDDITRIFNWLYLGGVRNTRKTLPYIDVWYDFKWDTREPKNLQIPTSVEYYHIPFDDGDLEAAIPIWSKCKNEILVHKSNGKTVFISCYEGVSRSAVLAIWLACIELGSYQLALQHVKERRKIHPDKAFIPFLNQLKKEFS